MAAGGYIRLIMLLMDICGYWLLYWRLLVAIGGFLWLYMADHDIDAYMWLLRLHCGYWQLYWRLLVAI